MRRLNRPFYQPFLYWFCRSACWVAFKVGWGLSVNGTENVPESGAVIIAANHRSLADPPLVGVSMRRPVHFLAKEELFKFKPFGWLIGNLNAHPLKRSTGDVAAFKTAVTVLKNGDALILFPEGRRSKTDEPQKGKAGVGMLAALSKAPVVPCYIHNSGHLKERARLGVSFGRPLYFEESDTYQTLADRVMGEILKLKSARTERTASLQAETV